MRYGFNDDRSRFNVDTAISNAISNIDGTIDSKVAAAVSDAIGDAIDAAVASQVADAVSAAEARIAAQLAEKADEVHYHNASDITSGLLSNERIQDSGWTYLIGSEQSTSTENFARWRARAGIVFVQVMLRDYQGAQANQNIEIGYIPAGYRPSKNVEDAGYLGANNDHSATIWIDTDGKIIVRSAGTNIVTQFFGTTCYPIG